MKILLSKFNAKVGRESTFQPKISKESVHTEGNDIDIISVNFETSNNPILKRTKYPHYNIHIYTCTLPNYSISHTLREIVFW